ncbi:hypothetical protein T11_8877 [Trichinella zimbabwensis]|uniref:Uncharacterized protein n=1 Tax=Trichinella zimbabwensis TaxID=268475 RepID=A0A0V1I260_9BILA|nr:hypothetical protein T11_8877 [Trichinella zimbabwensis]
MRVVLGGCIVNSDGDAPEKNNKSVADLNAVTENPLHYEYQLMSISSTEISNSISLYMALEYQMHPIVMTYTCKRIDVLG